MFLYFSGQLIIARASRADKNHSPEDYADCGACGKSGLLKKYLRQHNRRCTGLNCKDNRSILINSRKVWLLISKYANNAIRRRIFPVLRVDEITDTARFDTIIIKFANFQADKYRESQHNDDMIRTKIRRLGRFKLIAQDVSKELNQKDPERYPVIQDFGDIFVPAGKSTT